MAFPSFFSENNCRCKMIEAQIMMQTDKERTDRRRETCHFVWLSTLVLQWFSVVSFFASITKMSILNFFSYRSLIADTARG